MAKKQWRGWVLELRNSRIRFVRHTDGRLVITYCPGNPPTGEVWLAPTEARRLFQQLSGDYRD